jgi:hypothetical protein
MKKKNLGLVLFVVSSMFSAFAANSQENAISALEAKSAVLTIDSYNHINSIQQKKTAASKASKNASNVDVVFKAWGAIDDKTYELLTNSMDLKNDAFALMNSMHKNDPLSLMASTKGKANYGERINVLIRELTCTEFSLYLMTNKSGMLPNESLSLSNIVYKECNKINFGEPVLEQNASAPLKKQELSRKK